MNWLIKRIYKHYFPKTIGLEYKSCNMWEYFIKYWLALPVFGFLPVRHICVLTALVICALVYFIAHVMTVGIVLFAFLVGCFLQLVVCEQDIIDESSLLRARIESKLTVPVTVLFWLVILVIGGAFFSSMIEKTGGELVVKVFVCAALIAVSMPLVLKCIRILANRLKQVPWICPTVTVE